MNGFLAALIGWSTYFGGSGTERVRAVALDANGNVFVAGVTSSTDFPTASPFQAASGGGNDAFVAKLDPTGTILIWSSYFGGTGSDEAFGLAVDGSGNAYLCGETNSNGLATPGAFDTTRSGTDAFVAKVNANGTLAWATYLGGGGIDRGRNCAVDASGQLHLVGGTASSDFPTTAGAFDTTYGGNEDAFVAVLTADGSGLVWSSFLGGAAADFGRGIAIDGTGNVYATGNTNSADFPDSFGNALGGTRDGFVAKVSAGGGALAWSRYLGGDGSAGEQVNAVTVDANGDVFVVGDTPSAAGLATAGAFQPALSGTEDAFVARIGPNGELRWCTYLGGTGIESGNGVAVSASGNAFVAGETSSSNFPLLEPFDLSWKGNEGFVAMLSSNGDALVWSSFLGGSTETGGDAADAALAIALDPSEMSLVVAGVTNSAYFPWPSVSGLQKTLRGTQDGFVVSLTTTTTTAIRVEDLRAWWSGERVSVSWRLVTGPDVEFLRLVTHPAGETVGSLEPVPWTDEYEIADPTPPVAPAYLLEVRTAGGGAELYGPISPGEPARRTPAPGCRVAAPAEAGFPLTAALAATLLALCARRLFQRSR